MQLCQTSHLTDIALKWGLQTRIFHFVKILAPQLLSPWSLPHLLPHLWWERLRLKSMCIRRNKKMKALVAGNVPALFGCYFVRHCAMPRFHTLILVNYMNICRLTGGVGAGLLPYREARDFQVIIRELWNLLKICFNCMNNFQ